MLFILVLLFSASSCDRNETKKVLPENQFVQVYCDVVTYADIIKDESRIAFMDSILKSHLVSREELQRSVTYYSKESKRWEEIFSKVIEELEQREKNFAVRKDSALSPEPEPLPAIPFTDDQD